MVDVYYNIIDQEENDIYRVISPNKIVPAIGKNIVVRNKDYTVVDVEELIDYDDFRIHLTITVKERTFDND